jgi:hypothetical protein
MVVLLLNLVGWQSFDMPRELLPEDARAGDTFEVRFARDREKTKRIAVENKRLLDDPLEREDG